jgi:hypothetical protein
LLHPNTQFGDILLDQGFECDDTSFRKEVVRWFAPDSVKIMLYCGDGGTGGIELVNVKPVLVPFLCIIVKLIIEFRILDMHLEQF